MNLELDPAETQELDELQRWMALKLRELRGLPKSPETSALSRERFTGNDRLKPVEQLEVYRQQFWLRHTSALLEDFPGLSGILGQADWERLIESYLLEHPPTSFTLRDLGALLPAHVENAEWLTSRELCEDMAKLEWAYVELFDAALLPPVSAEKIASVPEEAWNTARLILQPSLQFVSSRYPVAELRLALRKSQGEHHSAAIALPDATPERLVLYRRGNDMYREALSHASFALLRKLQGGAPLLAACEAVGSELPEAASEVESQIGPWFQRWASLGWVVDVEL
ncbi:MAG: putative DNA-binding domain-containing protein [Polyangiaceae bacterium]